MNKTFLLLFFISLNIGAQTILEHNKKYIDSEDKWIAFQKNEEGKYNFGFIYIDAEAGLTLDHKGSFSISEDGTFLPEQKNDSELGSIKVRLENNNVQVAWIPEHKLSELNVSKTPSWLKHYKNDLNSTKRLFRWGYLYNSWGDVIRQNHF